VFMHTICRSFAAKPMSYHLFDDSTVALSKHGSYFITTSSATMAERYTQRRDPRDQIEEGDVGFAFAAYRSRVSVSWRFRDASECRHGPFVRHGSLPTAACYAAWTPAFLRSWELPPGVSPIAGSRVQELTTTTGASTGPEDTGVASEYSTRLRRATVPDRSSGWRSRNRSSRRTRHRHRRRLECPATTHPKRPAATPPALGRGRSGTCSNATRPQQNGGSGESRGTMGRNG